MVMMTEQPDPDEFPGSPIQADSPFGLVKRDAGVSAKAYDQISTALMRGRLRAGQRLVLRSLAGELGVSVTPVRDALQRLESEGAIVLDARGIAHVPTLTPERYAEIMDLRIELEGRAAARAASIASTGAVTRLERIHASLAAAKARNDIDTTLAENERFHFGVFALAEMPVLYRIMQTLWMQCGPTLRLLYVAPDHRPPEHHPHCAVLAALRERAPEQARRALQSDLEHGAAIIRNQIAHPPS